MNKDYMFKLQLIKQQKPALTSGAGNSAAFPSWENPIWPYPAWHLFCRFLCKPSCIWPLHWTWTEREKQMYHIPKKGKYICCMCILNKRAACRGEWDGFLTAHLVRWRLDSLSKQHLPKVFRRPSFLRILAKVEPATFVQMIKPRNTWHRHATNKTHSKLILLTRHIRKAGLTPQNPDDWQTALCPTRSRNRFVFKKNLQMLKKCATLNPPVFINVYYALKNCFLNRKIHRLW